MTTVHPVVRATGSTGAEVPAYRVDIRAGRHRLVADEPAELGGGDLGPSPMGLMLSALVACTATTLRMYAGRKGWPLAGIEVDVRYHPGDPKCTAIERTITLPGDLTDEQRRRLAEIAERTPVTLAISRGTPIATTFLPPGP